ncbi:hypothetical protein UNDYM_2310 [Undibacterium sp. YM2]|uniref:DUF3237 domain-containing protein n=1 Tax=Undibacterium sp. YM2 TaxID=2058625 RepID=UPI001331DC50|nr:DUF3237 domain-containing protein [Undibacterium sp. YM2]BBB66563.1 hypothetical protein UNDYM_2310 [Undibacterium sp. YM2]
MSTIDQGPKTSEKEFISEVQRFLSANGYIQQDECHFDGDNDERADVELVLVTSRWPAEMPGALLLEAKSHHSKDSPNTINKAFGQLLKETNKSLVTRAQREHCLGLLIPIDGATWTDPKGESINRGSGIDYYRTGFQRIDADVFAGFGRLVNARYVLAFSVLNQYLEVFNWDAFHVGNQPLARLTAQ